MTCVGLRHMGVVGLFVLLLSGCGDVAGGLAGSDQSSSPLRAGANFAVCDKLSFTRPEPQGFNSWQSTWWSRRGARHTTQDVITTPEHAVDVGGFFAYGSWDHPLRGEDIDVTINDCGGWQNAGSATTNDNGYADIPYDTAQIGRFDVVSFVAGDASHATSTLHVLPRGTHMVVFDIDGTLTTDNGQFMRQLMNNDYVPKAFESAAQATRAWHDKGYTLVYLSGRPRGALALTRQWLTDLGFAPGLVHITNYIDQVRPHDNGVGRFKRAYLASLQAQGYALDYAYGNEPTDLYAYMGRNIKPEHIFTLGEKAGMASTQPLPYGYARHLAFIADAPAAAPQREF